MSTAVVGASVSSIVLGEQSACSPAVPAALCPAASVGSIRFSQSTVVLADTLRLLLSRMVRLVSRQTELIRDLLQCGLDDRRLDECTHNFRRLRNACVVDGHVVDSGASDCVESVDAPTASEPMLMCCETERLVTETVGLIERLTEGNSYARCDDRYLVMARVATQFLGNLIVRYRSFAQLLVWTASSSRPRYWPTLLRHSDARLVAYSSMVFFNLLTQHTMERLCFDSLAFLPVVEAVFQNEADRTFAVCDQTLDFVCVLLMETIAHGAPDEAPVDSSNVAYFACLFTDMYKYIDWQSGSFGPHSNQRATCRRCLAVVAAASVHVRLVEQLRADRRLFDAAVDFLKRIVQQEQQSYTRLHADGAVGGGGSTVRRNRPGTFTTEDTPAVLSNSDERCHFGTIKASLVRLIGNLCHRCAVYQRLAADADALYPLLDCTAASLARLNDDPFLTQWAIFAVRQLCENSPENQNRLFQLSNTPADGAGGWIVNRERLLATLGPTSEMDQLGDTLGLAYLQDDTEETSQPSADRMDH